MRRRVFAFELQRTTQIDDAFSIEPQRFDCGATCRGQAEQRQTVFAPGEVFAPLIFARMIERNQFAADRIKRMGFVVFGIVAALTGKREVAGDRFAAEVFGCDVIVRMFLSGVRIGTDAVFATAPRALPDELPQLFGDALFSHAGRA